MEVKNYSLEFVERTIILLETLSDEAVRNELEVTFLLNCLLGLIVTTSEYTGKKDIDLLNQKVCELDIEQQKLIPKEISYINCNLITKQIKNKLNNETLLRQVANDKIKIELNVDVDRYKQARNLKLKDILKKIRNGVAHQNIQPINLNEKWVGVRIFNNNKDDIKDFEIEFSAEQLADFSLFLARMYVAELKKI